MGQDQWHGPARFVHALKNVGFEVAGIGRKGDLIAKTDFLDRMFFADIRDEKAMLKAIHEAVQVFEPDIILPGSDNHARYLQLYRKLVDDGRVELSDRARHAIERSSFSPEVEPLLFNKIDLLAKLEASGIRIPEQQELFTIGNADEFIQRHGYPIILKPNVGSSSMGIHICRHEDELFAVLPQCLASGKRYCIQRYLGNQTAVIHYVAKNGEMVAWNMAFRVQTHPGETGQTSVMRVIDNPEILDTAREICRVVRYNGMGAPQFVVENEGDGNAWLMELNPRMGSYVHLWQTWSGETVDQVPPQVGLTVALYPQEVIRDPESPHLSGLVDKPQDDAGLMEGYDQLIAYQRAKAPVTIGQTDP
jgi:hypothetical protein